MYPIDYTKNPLFIECDNNIHTIKQAEITGSYSIWNIERIKGAFNYGKGTISDFIEYAKSNRCYCNVFDIETGKKIN